MDDNNNGHEDIESPEEVIEQIRHQDGIGGNLSSSNLSLLKTLLIAPESWREQQFYLMCEFLDGDEALDHVAAFQEAKDLGMDTSFNVGFMFALAASNRKIGRTSRAANIFDSVSHFRYTSNQPTKDKNQTNRSTGTALS